jgi:hypothetical protein
MNKSHNHSRYLMLIGCCALCLCLSGCFNISTNVSDNAALWGQYEYKKEYVLMVDVFLINTEEGLFSRPALVPAHSFKSERRRANLFSAPYSIQDYESDPQGAVVIDYGSWKRVINVIGIVRAGTVIRCKLLKNNQGYSWYFGSYKNLLFPFAEIMTGNFAGEIVDIRDVSVYCDVSEGITSYRPDKTILRKKD